MSRHWVPSQLLNENDWTIRKALNVPAGPVISSYASTFHAIVIHSPRGMRGACQKLMLSPDFPPSSGHVNLGGGAKSWVPCPLLTLATVRSFERWISWPLSSA